MTQERCPQCHTVVAADEIGGFLRCERCGTRFPKPRRKKDGAAAWARADTGGLGIHPALARRYERPEPEAGAPGELTTDDEDSPAGVELSPSLLKETAQRRPPTGPEAPQAREQSEEPATAIDSRPGALRSSDDGRRRSTRPLRPSKSESSSAVKEVKDTPLERPPPARPAPPAEALPVLPGFEILEQVGKGAMGRVFRALDHESGKLAAVKILAPELAARPDFVARFEREAAALKRVDHAGIVKVQRSGAYGEHHWFSMEFIEGVALRRILEGGPLPPGRALAFARQIAQGLRAAHDVGVIHRDLKPENILVERLPGSTEEDPDERLVLVDFGLAGMLDEGDDPHPNLTKSRMTMGTVNYMAPEQRTDAKRVDQRADIYAAGVILYELLTGDLPLGRFALPTERDLNLPPQTDECIMRALARDAKERYQDATELDEGLARLQVELTKAVSMDTLVGRSGIDADADDDDADDDDDDVVSSLPGRRVPVPKQAAEGRSTGGGRNQHWHTAPPWVKRPELLWGVLALAIGAGGGLLFSLGDDDDAPAEPSFVEAAGPVIAEGTGGLSLTFTGAGEVARWSPLAEGFAADEGGVRYESDEVRRGDPALLLHPTPLTTASAGVSALLHAAPREGEDSGYGGLLLRTAGGEAIGVVRFTDGSCGVLTVEQASEGARVAPFRCPKGEGPMAVSLSCTFATGKCALSAGGSAPVEYEAKLGEGPARLALACADAACSFGPIPEPAAEE